MIIVESRDANDRPRRFQCADQDTVNAVIAQEKAQGRTATVVVDGEGRPAQPWPTVREDDGYDRPMIVAVSTYRPRVRYTDMGRVVAGGRVYRVNGPKDDAHGGRFYGWLYVTDDGRLYASPDKIGQSHPGTNDGYARMRWVGGFTTRGEVVAYLRAHRDAESAWWQESGRVTLHNV